jgi:hypothetical protein
MLTKNELEKLAQLRLDDSVFLLSASRCSSAYYLAGYSVELALKACIAKLIQPDTIPDKEFVNAIYKHNFQGLVATAGLLPELNTDLKADPQFAGAWGIASQWTTESRYAVWDCISAASLVSAIADPKSGVFRWVKTHW